jgi:hypothetical protein
LLGHVDPDHRTTEAFHESFDPTFLEAPIRATDALMAALNNLAHQEPIRARNGSRNAAVSGGRRNLSSEGRNGMTKFIYSDDNSVKHKVEASDQYRHERRAWMSYEQGKALIMAIAPGNGLASRKLQRG